MELQKRAPAPILFDGVPSPDDVWQGNGGNCWLTAAILMTVGKDPALIKEIVRKDDPASDSEEESSRNRGKGRGSGTKGGGNRGGRSDGKGKGGTDSPSNKPAVSPGDQMAIVRLIQGDKEKAYGFPGVLRQTLRISWKSINEIGSKSQIPSIPKPLTKEQREQQEKEGKAQTESTMGKRQGPW